MQTEEFLLRVQKRGPDSSLDTTVAATIATFEALGQNLLTEEARRMTAQLPRELSDAVSVGGVEMQSGQGPNGVDALYGQIANRSGLNVDQATAHARVMIAVLKKAISDGEITDMALELPTTLTGVLNV